MESNARFQDESFSGLTDWNCGVAGYHTVRSGTQWQDENRRYVNWASFCQNPCGSDWLKVNCEPSDVGYDVCSGVFCMRNKSIDIVSKKKMVIGFMQNQPSLDGRTYAVMSHERGIRLNDAGETSQKIVKNHGSRAIARVDREDNEEFIVEQVRKLKLKPAKLG